MSEFVVITGMSGAGRTTAADVLDDLGWFVIDNLPPALIGKVSELVQRPGSEMENVALVAGRGSEYLDELSPAVQQLRATAHRVRVLFLDASDDVLVRRFEGTRRRHPLPAEGVVDSITQERELLSAIRDQADIVVDTSDLNVHQLRERLLELFPADEGASQMQTAVVSFGYKHGIPLDVDMVLDCRFLPNPYWVDELRPLSGQDQAIRDYVLSKPETEEFLERVDELFALLLPAYVKEGKSYLSIAVGCTGGRHRSVVLAEELARRMARHGFEPSIVHRDVDR